MNTIFSHKANDKQSPIELYWNPKSGHCHKVALMLSLLDIPYQTIDVDMANGQHKAPEFIRMNPFGQVPVIDDNGLLVGDSNAILIYLAKKYDVSKTWYSEDPLKSALIQRWLSVAAGEVASGPASARLVTVFGASLNHQNAIDKAHQLLRTMEQYLSDKIVLVGDALTIADIACYSYIQHAPEGKVSLASYPNVRRWLANITDTSGFVGMEASPDLSK